MNTRERLAPWALLALAATLVAGSCASADEPTQEAQKAAQQLQRNLHDIRAALDREASQLEGVARASAARLVVDPKDSPGIGAMREQLTQSLEHLESRCLGIDVNVKDGNAVLICGNNNGTAESANVTTTTRTTIAVPSPPSPTPAPAPTSAPAPDTKSAQP
jgi:C4-dicarboxylate-specific signal transduction histidine kinase